MTDAELNKLSEQDSSEWAMNAGCTDYACYCHAKVPVLVAEIRRLREDNAALRAEVENWKKEAAWATDERDRLVATVEQRDEEASALRAEVARLSRVVVEDTTQTQE